MKIDSHSTLAKSRYPLHTKGYALIVVMWITALLGLVVAFSVNAARMEAQITAANSNSLKGEMLAQTGIWLTIESLLQAQLNSNSIQHAGHYEFNHANHKINVTIDDLASRLHLNYSNSVLIEALITTSAFAPNDPQTLTESIQNWIDSDTETANKSNESLVYRQADLEYGPANRQFSSVDELRLVAGMTDKLYRDISPFLTVYGQHSQINISAADPQLRERLETIDTDIQAYLNESMSNYFIIVSTVEINGQSISNEAIVTFTGRRISEPYRIISWLGNNRLQGLNK